MNQLIESAPIIIENTKKRVRKVHKIEAMLPLSGTQRFLSNVSKDLEQLGKFKILLKS